MTDMAEIKSNVPPERKAPSTGHGNESPKEDRLNEIRGSQAYQQLKDKFVEGQIDVRRGIPRNSLAIGDLVDILDVYLQVAESDPRMAFQSVENIARIHLGVDIDVGTERELGILHYEAPVSFHRDNPLYTIPVDLQRILDQQLGELSHYPGGIRIRANLGEKDFFHLFFPNLQGDDDGKPVKEIFEELHLPVVSMI